MDLTSRRKVITCEKFNNVKKTMKKVNIYIYILTAGDLNIKHSTQNFKLVIN